LRQRRQIIGAYRDGKNRIRPVTARTGSSSRSGLPLRPRNVDVGKEYDPNDPLSPDESITIGGVTKTRREWLLESYKKDDGDRSPTYRVPPTVYPIIVNDVLEEYPSGEEYPDLYAIAIFGSQVSGAPKVDSDIDVMIVVDTKDWRYHSDLPSIFPHMDEAEERLSQKLGKKVEITRMTKIGGWGDFLTREGVTKDEFIRNCRWVYDPHQAYSMEGSQ